MHREFFRNVSQKIKIKNSTISLIDCTLSCDSVVVVVVIISLLPRDGGRARTAILVHVVDCVSHILLLGLQLTFR